MAPPNFTKLPATLVELYLKQKTAFSGTPRPHEAPCDASGAALVWESISPVPPGIRKDLRVQNLVDQSDFTRPPYRGGGLNQFSGTPDLTKLAATLKVLLFF